jgi:hypothetical protein
MNRLFRSRLFKIALPICVVFAIVAGFLWHDQTGQQNAAQSPKQPSDQEATLPIDAEEAFYVKWDERLNQGIPLEMIGIPRLDENAKGMYFKPTDADRQRLRELEAESEKAAGKDLLTREKRKGYFPYSVDERKTVYVYADYRKRYETFLKEYRAIQERSMREAPATAYSVTPYKQQDFADGTQLIYYRRRNGDLVRSIRKPDGTVRKWVIGWADLTSYKLYPLSGAWRDD